MSMLRYGGRCEGKKEGIWREGSGIQLYYQCRQENGSLHDPPMETSFSHWNTLLLSQDENPIIGRIFAGNPNIWFLRCLPHRNLITSLNPPTSRTPNATT